MYTAILYWRSALYLVRIITWLKLAVWLLRAIPCGSYWYRFLYNKSDRYCWSIVGQQVPASAFLRIFSFKFPRNPEGKTSKSVISQKLCKNRTKKVIYAKNERRVNSNLHCKFGHFWRKLNFWGTFGFQTRNEILCPSFF